MSDKQNESRTKKFVTGVANIITKRVTQIAGAVAGLITDLLEKGAELPKGTANQLHEAAKSLLDIEKQKQDAGGVSTFIHATGTATKGFIGAILEIVRAVDIAALDNKILDKIDEKFQEFNGDKSKFKAWLKKHPRLNAYAIYYLSLMMLFFMGQKGYEEYFDKEDMKPSKKAVKFINEKLENNELIQKIKNSPWLKSEEKEISKQITPPTDNSKPNSATKIVNSTKQEESDIITIKVTKEDRLETLAKKYGTTVDAIKKTNGLKSDKIKVGDKLTIKKSPDVVIIKVTKEDRLETLAKKYNTTVTEIKKMNGLKSDKIKVGDKLTIRKSTNNKQVASEKNNSKPSSDKKIVDNNKQEKPDFNKIAETLDESKFIYKNKADGRLYIDFDYIRKQAGSDKTKRLAYLKKIQSNGYYLKRFRDTLIQCEGFEPDTYYIGDGYATQGVGMTHSYCVLPGQEPEEWMFDKKLRTKATGKYTPIVDFMGKIRSYNDLWQQIDLFCIDPEQNPFAVYKYILGKEKIKTMSVDGFIAISVASFQKRDTALKIVDNLIDAKSPTGLTTDQKKIRSAFMRGAYPDREAKELTVYNGGENTNSVTIGQHHSNKQKTYKDAEALLDANANGGNEFNVFFDRQVNTAERGALFKMFYHITDNQNDSRFFLNENDFELITALNGKFGKTWEKHFDEKIRNSKGRQHAKYVIQKKIVLRILRNPKEAYVNTSEIRSMLNGWHVANNQNEAENAIMMAQLANTRRLGF